MEYYGWSVSESWQSEAKRWTFPRSSGFPPMGCQMHLEKAVLPVSKKTTSIDSPRPASTLGAHNCAPMDFREKARGYRSRSHCEHGRLRRNNWWMREYRIRSLVKNQQRKNVNQGRPSMKSAWGMHGCRAKRRGMSVDLPSFGGSISFHPLSLKY